MTCAIRVGGVRHTIKDGIIFDAKRLLADVRRMVREAKDREGREIVQPGLEKLPDPKRPAKDG